MSSPADADDVFQQASLRALEVAHSLREPARVRAWICRILRNTVADRQRAKAWLDIDALPTGELPMAEPVLQPGATCTCSLTLMARLKPEYAVVLRRIEIDGGSIATFARDFAISPNNATVRLHRARRALRAQLELHCGVRSMHECLACVCNERRCCGTATDPSRVDR